MVDAIPAGARSMRGWDLGATPKTESNDPDWTAATKIGKFPDGRYIMAHHCHDRLSPTGVERLIKNTAEADGKEMHISLPQDPGQAGKSQVTNLTKLLAGFTVRATPESGDKTTRFSPFSAQAAGNVWVLRGPWNETWFSSLEARAGHSMRCWAQARTRWRTSSFQIVESGSLGILQGTTEDPPELL
ncbi:phage terminase large subunit [Sinorhizobium arboris]|uniref:phage terminase large subunit n=1 Tax=Sinorhizobium arboris TaxID=76745 RepID=UPI000406FFA8|nr:phage terminase large subunit [Sinorhizobium arboris]